MCHLKEVSPKIPQLYKYILIKYLIYKRKNQKSKNVYRCVTGVALCDKFPINILFLLLFLFLFDVVYIKFGENFKAIYNFSITEPITTVLGGPDLFINAGSTINLTCIVQNLPIPPSYVVWTHNNEVG